MLSLFLLIAEEAHMGDKAEMIVEVHGYTWFQSNGEKVANTIQMTITYTTVNKTVHILRVEECVTRIRFYTDSMSTTLFALPAKSNTNSPVVVYVIAHLGDELVGRNCVLMLYLR